MERKSIKRARVLYEWSGLVKISPFSRVMLCWVTFPIQDNTSFHGEAVPPLFEIHECIPWIAEKTFFIYREHIFRSFPPLGIVRLLLPLESKLQVRYYALVLYLQQRTISTVGCLRLRKSSTIYEFDLTRSSHWKMFSPASKQTLHREWESIHHDDTSQFFPVEVYLS